MDYYPINLKIKGRKVLIVGGGQVARRKMVSLLDAGAKVTVISKTFLPDFTRLADEGRISIERGGFSPSSLSGVFLVIAATSDRALNRLIAERAKEKNILVNDCGDPENSSFINVAAWVKGNILLTCSTQGRDPARAKEIKEICRDNCRLPDD